MKNGAKAILVLLLLVLAGGASYIVLSYAAVKPNPTTPATAECTPSGTGSTNPPTTGSAATANWTTYHQNNSRSGTEPMRNFTTAHRLWSGPTGLDGQVYAEPLVCGQAVFLATEADSVYALNATTGAVAWRTHLGNPVPLSSLPCGDIDPSGITGTPVIDPMTGTLFVVALLDPAQHVLFALDTHNGSVKFRMAVDPVGADPRVQQQRGALTLANGLVYIPYGGLWGDCGSYHGWVVAARADGSGALLSYQVPTGRAGGIWSPAGATVLPGGNLLVATGNSDATTTFDYGDSVIALTPTLQERDYFAPTNWAQLNSGDTDLGSVAPTILPDGHVFQVGKEGVGYLLSGTHLGGIGGQISFAPVCSGAYGGTAHVGQSILVPCVDGLVNLLAGPTTLSVIWRTSSFDAGSPIVTANIVWAVDVSTGDLLGFNLATGQELFSFALGSVVHFCTPAAAPGSLFVAAGNQVYAFGLL